MFLPKALVCFSLCLVAIEATGSIYKRKIEKQILDNILSSVTYDPRIRPAGPNGTIEKPLDVSVDLFVLGLRIDDEKMMYSLDLYFRQQWIDERLKYSQIPGINYVTLDDDEYIWTPDLFFNDYKGYTHDVTRPNVLLRIHPDGTIKLSKRYTLMVPCAMDFRRYPFDRQVCKLRMESYSWTAEDLVLSWKDPDIKSPHFSNNLIMQYFTLDRYWMHSGTVKASNNNYTYLTMSFQLTRNYHYYTLQVFVPCAMCALVAYCTFWISTKHFAARLLLAVATLFFTSLTVSNVNLDVPKTSYSKSIDLYTGVTLTFAFAAFLLTILVYFSESRRSRSTNDPKANGNVEAACCDPDQDASRMVRLKRWLLKDSTENTDVACRIFYPFLFVLFQVVYWTGSLVG